MATIPKRLKVLLSAYACEPNRGSEPGVGWRWVTGLAGRVDLTVATRANNRGVIERQLAHLEGDHPLHGVRFVYHDLPGFVVRLKRSGFLRTMPYYFLWQWTLARRMRSEAMAADVVHHLTFCTPLCPGFWSDDGAARVIGPVGAPMVNPHYLSLFGNKRMIQRMRGLLMRHLLMLPWLRRAFLGAAAVVPANSEAASLLRVQGVACKPVMLDTGASDVPVPIQRPLKPPGECKFLYAGVLERRKGLELILRAFAGWVRDSSTPLGARVPNELNASQLITDHGSTGIHPASHPYGGCDSALTVRSASLTLLGTGPDLERLQTLAQDLGIGAHVHFPGSVPQAEVSRYLAEADVFAFTSVRDTSGGVNLEAMAAGLPLICIAHQGVGDITDETCALRIPPGPIQETTDALTAGMRHLAADPELRRELGTRARHRALEAYSWEEKFERMLGIYEEVSMRPSEIHIAGG